MKKFMFCFIFSITLLSLLFGFNFYQFFTKLSVFGAENLNDTTSSTYYAKVQSDSVYFYSEPISLNDYRLFKLPTSYFVLLTGNANDDFYYCKYDDKIGCVKKNEVTPMIGTPTTPYASFASFRMWNMGGTELRSSPYKKPQNVIANIDYLEDNLIYYGSIEGDELIPKKSNIWYYCKYVGDQKNEFGYLYSNVCDLLSDIPINMETFIVKTGELFPQSILPQKTSKKMSGTAKTLLIVGVCLPCVVIIYLLIKPTLISESNDKKASKNKAKRRKRHGDYFEFNDSDLT